MADRERKSLDELSDESEKCEKQLETVIARNVDESERVREIAEITAWLRAVATQGRFLPPGSADRRALKSLLEYWNVRLRDQHLDVQALDRLAEFDPSAGVVLVGECPYPGLEPYTASRRGTFFGREELVAAYVAHFEEAGNRILLIIGGSGSGKSSLALAGVLPRLAERHAAAWLFGPRLTPGAHPLAELAASVAQAVGQPTRAVEIERGLRARPGEALAQLAGLCQDKPLVLLIDQFEELLTLCSDADEQSALAEVLCALSDPAASAGVFCCRILLTLRTDHLARFESNSSLKPLHMRLVGEGNERYLSAIGFAYIRRAIKEPAEEVGLRFIPAALIDQLASQTAGLSNGLPLLQFALRRLWDTRPTNDSGEPLDLITAEMMRALPDVERALGTVAEALYRLFSQSEQRICDRLLLELVVLDESFEEPLRRRRNEAELRRVLQERFPVPTDIARVIASFVAAGLLRRFGEGQGSELEVAHEALLRHWDHIYRLVTGAEVKERLLLIRQIGRDASEWVGHGRTDGYLSLRGERLNLAVTCAGDGWLAAADSREYVDACGRRQEREGLIEQRAREAERLRRYTGRVVAGLAAAVLAVVALTVFFLRARQAKAAAEQAEARAVGLERIAHGQQLAAQAVANAENRLDLALLLGLEAERKGVSGEARRALINSFAVSPRVSAFLRAHTNRVTGLAFTPDGKTMASSDVDKNVYLWNVDALDVERPPLRTTAKVNAVRFSPDGNTLAGACDDGTIVLWDLTSHDVAANATTLKGHKGAVYDLDFGPGGRQLVSASADHKVILWDVADRRSARVFTGHTDEVTAVAFGASGTLASGGKDRSVILWDVKSGSVRRRLMQRPEEVVTLAISPDGGTLAAGYGDGAVALWPLTGSPGGGRALVGHTRGVSHVEFSADGRHLASASRDRSVRVWDLKADNPEPLVLSGYREEMYALAFGGDGSMLASGSGDGQIVLWNLLAGSLSQPLVLAPSEVETVAFDSSGSTLVTSGRMGVVLRDVATNEGRQVDATPTRSLAVSNDDKIAVSRRCGVGSAANERCSPGDILILSAANGDRLREVAGAHREVISSLAFNSTGKLLASGGHDGDVKIWDAATGQRQGSPIQAKSPVNVVSFSRDDRFLAAGTDHEAIVWDRMNGERKALTEFHEGSIKAISFSADSQELAIGGLSSDVVLWDFRAGKSRRLVRHKKPLRALAFSPKGSILASVSDDGDILLWDVGSGEPLGVPLPGSNTSTSIAFDFTGDRLAAAGPEGALMVWNVGLDSLRRRACEVAGRNLEPGEEWKRFFRDERYQVTCGQPLLAKANRAAKLGQDDAARTAYTEAVAFASTRGDYLLANGICWSGTLNGFAKLVLPACDRAVDLAPPVEIGNCYDSRGVARAVTGNIPGAIADLEKFIAWTGSRAHFESAREQRRGWIETLRGGKAPFDQATLQQLKTE